MVKRLIVNADDFGLTEGVTYGIFKAYRDGIVTQTTAMMNLPFVEEALKLAKQYPDLKIGVHLNITIGIPLTNGKSLVADNGRFIRPNTTPKGYPEDDLDEVYLEWKAQIEKFIQITGHKPSHLDSHHHIALRDYYVPVLLKLAKEYDLPIRQHVGKPVDDRYEFVGFLQEEIEQIDPFKDIFEREEELMEFMVHPAFVDQDLMECSSFNIGRIKELAYVTDPQIMQTLKDMDIELITHADLNRL